MPGFGLASFRPYLELADAIVAGDPDGAEIAINTIFDSVESNIRQIIAPGT